VSEAPARGRLGVRLTATLAAALVLAVLFVASGLLLVGFVHRSLVASVDSAASARARDVAALASSGRLGATVANTGEDVALVQVVGPNEAVLTSTDNVQGEPAVIATAGLRRSLTRQTRTGLAIGTADQNFRMTALPVALPTGPGWVLAATSLRQVDVTVTRLSGALTAGLPVLLLAVTAVIWVAVGRALRPVERIRLHASAINADQLSRRVPVPRSRDAVAELAVTMNQMLARLEASAMRQQQFVGDASHELKSPLTALRAQIDVALAYPDSTDTAAVLARVRQQSQRMAELIEDLLFLARTDETDTTGAGSRPGTRVDLDELVLQEVHRLRELGATVTVTHWDAAAVTGSDRDLARLLRNLCDNAAAHAHKAIEIGLTVLGTDAVITVTDDGPGIPLEARASIFERFTRLESDRARSGSSGGTGLGLAIAQEIATLHQGNIQVSDRADGQSGAVFSVNLPLADTTSGRSGRAGHRLKGRKQQRDPGLGGTTPDQQ
jgi:signal transduction histidine kinase